MWPFPCLLPWFGCCCNPSRYLQLWTWYICWGSLWLGEWGGIHFYSFSSIYWGVSNLVLVIVSHLFSLQRRNWLHRVTWICGLSLFWGVLAWTCAFWLFLLEWVGVVFLGGCLVLWVVIWLRGPIWLTRAVSEIRLHWTLCCVFGILLGLQNLVRWMLWIRW